MLDLWRVRCFIAVAELEHVGLASEVLHISPSPLSRQIRQLEDELGVRLFNRVGKRLQLTSAGREFLRMARGLIESAENVEREGKRLASANAGPVAVGYIQEAILGGMIPRVIRDLTDSSEGVIGLSIKQMRTVEQLRALESSKIDIGILGDPPTEAWFEHQLLSRESYSLVCSPAHRLSSVATLKLEHLRDEVWVGPSLEVWQSLADLLSSGDCLPGASYETFDIAASLAMVAEGVGYTVIQSSIARRRIAGLAFRPIPHSWLMLQLHAVWRRDALSGAARRVLDELIHRNAGGDQGLRKRTRPRRPN